MPKAPDSQDECTEEDNSQDPEAILERLIEEFFRDQWKITNPQ